MDMLVADCARKGVARVNVLKTDTEGYELELVREGFGLLARQHDAYVSVGVTLLPINPQHTLFAPRLDLLLGLDYGTLDSYESYRLRSYQQPKCSSSRCSTSTVRANVRWSGVATHRSHERMQCHAASPRLVKTST